MTGAEVFEQALAHLQSGRLDQAAEALRQAGALRPVHPNVADVWLSLGVAWHAKAELALARACFERAVETRPGYADALGNLAIVQQATGDIDGAIRSLRSALESEPGHVARAVSLSGMLQMKGELAEAQSWVQHALEHRPEDPDALYNLGNLRQYEGRLDAAIDCFDRACRARPGFADAKMARAFTLLYKGDYARGWPEYEARYTERLAQPISEAPALPFPMWRGEPLRGKRVLLVGEQGYGDQIQFVRYASLLAESGARVDLLVVPPLVRLLGSVAGVQRAFSTLTSPDYDYWAMLLSLPLRMGTRLENVPAPVSYLSAPAEETRKWAERLGARAGGRLRVGLVWSGGRGYRLDRFRSLHPDVLIPLSRVPGVCFVSLQTRERAAEAPGAGASFAELDFGADMGDFADTAGLIANLDLLISVDTAFAHLAGALGRPVWTLVSAIPDWRWMHDRADTPWYPATRLLRQDKLGDWAPVIARAARDLEALSARHAAGNRHPA